ncbi:hypothetical protein JXA47_13955 [Candidatus Sumerlaeota bacterium]|nr:hypothetical protein [Candidatus Sumerlaeota bacterium]
MALTSSALFLMVCLSMADPAIGLLIEENGTTDPGTIGEFTGGDSDPMCLGILSSGSMVYFESDPDAGAGADDAIVLFDEDASGGGINRFSIIASEEDLLSIATLPSPATLEANDIAIGDDDTVYALIARDRIYPIAWHIFRIPHLEDNSFGSPEIVAGPLQLGSPSGLLHSMAIDTSTDPDTLIIGIDDGNRDHDTSTNGIYTLDASQTYGTPTMIGGGAATLGAVSAAVGGVPGTDKGTCTSLTVLPSGNILVSHGGYYAGVARGNIVEIDRSTGAASLWLDASLEEGTPMTGCVRFNPDSDRVAVFWYVGADGDEPETDDRIDEYTTAGESEGTVVTEPEIELVANSSSDLNIMGNAFAIDGESYLMFLYNSSESLVRVSPGSPAELSVLSAD